MRLAGVPVDPDQVELAGHREAIEAAHDAGDWLGAMEAMWRAGAVRDRLTAARAARAAARRRVDASGYLEPPGPVQLAGPLGGRPRGLILGAWSPRAVEIRAPGSVAGAARGPAATRPRGGGGR